MKSKLLLVALLIFASSFSQSKIKVENGNLSIEFLKAKKVSNTFNLNSSTKVRSKKLQNISIKVKLKSLNDEDIDINKFSLVDHKNKLRYRPNSISYQPIVGYLGYIKLAKNKVWTNKYSPSNIIYEPEIKDTYTDYKLEGYTDVKVPMSFGTKKKSKKTIIYFMPHKFHKFKCLFFIAIIKEAKNPELELFYGNEKVSEIKL